MVMCTIVHMATPRADGSRTIEDPAGRKKAVDEA
jgi:hypothetical protein